MKKGRISRCPYCGRMINYFYLYDCKRCDFGYCSHCGGVFGVKYSPVAYMLVLGAVGYMLGVFGYWYLANKSIPTYSQIAIAIAVIVGVYFLLPFFIAPRKVITRGRLGGFPTRDMIPEYRPYFKRRRKVAPPDLPMAVPPHQYNGTSTVSDITSSIESMKIYNTNKINVQKEEKPPQEAGRGGRYAD